MIRGMLGGVLWGALLALGALVVLSQVAAPPTGHALVPATGDGPVAVAVAQQEAAAAAPADQPDIVPEEAPDAPAEATAAMVAATAESVGADDRGVDAAPAPQDPPVEADAAQSPPPPAPSPGSIAESSPAAPDGAANPTEAAALSSQPEPETAPAAISSATEAALPEATDDKALVPATGAAPVATVEGDPAVAASSAEAPPAVAPAVDVATAEAPRAVVPPSIVTVSPPPFAPPAATVLATLEKVAEQAPPAIAGVPARLETPRADPAPAPADAPARAPAVPDAAPEEAAPPVGEAAVTEVPAEAPQPIPATPPPVPEISMADKAPPSAAAPDPVAEASAAVPDVVPDVEPDVLPDVVAVEGGTGTRPGRLVLGREPDRDDATALARRLPRIIGPAAEPEPQAPATDPVLVEAEGLDDRPAIDRFARTFENPAGKPLFAIVLIDRGEPSLDRRSLAAMPFPVTFLLDPSLPESALAASIYREGGQEVAMLATGLPLGATASDLEVTFAAYGEVLPEAVAIADLEEGGFQGNREVATMVAPIAAGQGRGLLSWDRGLNAAEQVARRQGLRSGVIYRRLDGDGEDAGTMRRYLDRAAFKAAQEGRVIVAGETRAETVAALLAWAVEGRATTVALAPLSAALVAK